MKYLLNCRSFISLMVLFSFFDNLGMEKYDYTFKVLIVGDAAVGKTQIINKFVNNSFEEEYKATTNANYILKSVEYNGKFIQLQLLDSPGDEKFRYITLDYNKDAHLIVLVYAVNEKKTFNNIQSCVDDVKANTGKNTKFLLVGNKLDLEEERNVSTEEAKTYAAENGMEFIEVSAKDGTNINDMFKYSIEKLLNDMEKEENNFSEKTEAENIEFNNTKIKNSQNDNNGHKKNDINNNDLSFCDKYCSCCPCLKKTEGNVEEEKGGEDDE